ncbi:MAG: GtrA family protein [Alphaproteobacteria bacterium]|jgi:putative flippase GtrA|nr:GtrA family protein [Alphaproteobacteria bacterium]
MSRETLILQLARLRRFVIVGVLAAGVDIGLMQALILTGAPPLFARTVSLPVAMIVAWRLNRRFTFAASNRSQTGEALRYSAVAAAAALTNYTVFALLMALMPSIWPALAAAGGIATSMWVSFAGFQLFTFAPRREGRAN